ncbi:hypothetical protein RFI_16662 [Reticulomyxa filosa]|uniref:Uncharacterized protein n=1 Tax=Reticulomyxa filosa TaxID=46433 RepID=X6N2R3_RETFI|nr:hypothetical protein RFI_16662 [Reticulomyxa filosa]|eukprot:ETO20555.1 hypothetical protein RFI_16662 [Reticulomyxa filosa]
MNITDSSADAAAQPKKTKKDPREETRRHSMFPKDKELIKEVCTCNLCVCCFWGCFFILSKSPTYSHYHLIGVICSFTNGFFFFFFYGFKSKNKIKIKGKGEHVGKLKKASFRVKNEIFVLYDYYQPVKILGSVLLCVSFFFFFEETRIKIKTQKINKKKKQANKKTYTTRA